MRLLSDHLAPRLLGKDADQIEAIWRDLEFSTHATTIGAITAIALAAVDIALWDLRANRLADEQLVVAHAVEVAGVEEIDAGVDAAWAAWRCSPRGRRARTCPTSPCTPSADTSGPASPSLRLPIAAMASRVARSRAGPACAACGRRGAVRRQRLALEAAPAAGDEAVEQRRSPVASVAWRSRAAARSTARSWSSPAMSDTACARRASFFIALGAAGRRICAACQRSLARLRSSCSCSVPGSLRAAFSARRPRR